MCTYGAWKMFVEEYFHSTVDESVLIAWRVCVTRYTTLWNASFVLLLLLLTATLFLCYRMGTAGLLTK